MRSKTLTTPKPRSAPRKRVKTIVEEVEKFEDLAPRMQELLLPIRRKHESISEFEINEHYIKG